MSLSGKNIVVTGGASGIGLATVARCLQEGSGVALCDLSSSEGEARAKQLAEEHGQRCEFLPLDVTSTAEVDAVFRAAAARFGVIDAVFSNAGIALPRPAVECEDEDYLRVIEVNLNGTFRVARAALRMMYEQGRGSLVNCGSVLGSMGRSGAASYTAAKAGVVNMTRSLALEAAPRGVRVNCISPGYIDTPILQALSPDSRREVIALHPLGRLGRVDEVANAALFLMSDDASFVTGTNLVVDGGYSAGKA